MDLLHGLIIDERLLLTDEPFKKSIEELCRGVLDQWVPGEQSSLQLRDVLAMVPFLPTLGRPLAVLVDSLIALDIDPHEDYRNTAANVAWCLGSSMLALSKLKGWYDEMNLDPWFQICLNRYSWSSKVLEGLFSLSHLSYVWLSLRSTMGVKSISEVEQYLSWTLCRH